jgi:hypothetical protein
MVFAESGFELLDDATDESTKRIFCGQLLSFNKKIA